jgi:hypothetical protein
LLPISTLIFAMTSHAHDLDPPLGDALIDRIEAILTEAQQMRRPIEVDPFRGQLFEAFVTADAAGLLDDEAEPNLTADQLCRRLGERWGLADAMRESVERQQNLPPEQLSKMRMLWSVLRMWMEWEYAWARWPEFHDEAQ